MSEQDQKQVREPLFLRVPKQLRTELESRAQASERSLTAEIVFRLRNSLASEAA
jgi:hypothetical protein